MRYKRFLPTLALLGSVAVCIANKTVIVGGTQQPTTTSSSSSTPQSEQSKLTPEQIKEQNAKATRANELIAQANEAMGAKDWQRATDLLKQVIALLPTWNSYQSLGGAQLNLGQYEEAIGSSKKGIQMAGDDRDPDHAKLNNAIAAMLTNEGNAYLKLKKNAEAVEAFTKAAELSAHPGTAYFNLCALQYNIGYIEGALVACDKAIAADPAKADAYFIKGSLLIGVAKVDSNNKIQAVPGTVDALKKYLELAPNGSHADDVKEMLRYLGN